MSTQKRKDSARANGAMSCGPATPEGRARSRAARLTHGLTSDQILLERESTEKFNALREEYFVEYQPQTRSRFDLVDQLVITRWRLNRVLALQTALMDEQMFRQQPEIHDRFKVCDGETEAAIAYQHLIDDGGALESLNRHEARLSAEIRRTLRLLDTPPKNQKPHQEPSDSQPPCSDVDAPAADAPPSTIGHPPSTKPDSPPKNQKLHQEPSDAQPPCSDVDEPPADTPPSTIDHPPSTKPDSPPKNQRFHQEPSDAQPPCSDVDEPAADTPPSTIDHPPSTSSIDPPPPASADVPDREAPRIPPANTIHHPPSTIHPLIAPGDERAKL